jgi:tetratricopeptide (TPR) repeat protein
LVFYPAYCVDRLIWSKRWTFQATYDEIVALQDAPAVDAETSPPPSHSTADPYEAQIIAGSNAHVTGDVERALVEFTQAIEANPDGYDAYLNRGVAHQELGHWSEALADYQKAREINPDDPAAWNNVAMLLAACPDDEIRNGAKAAEYAQKACELTNWKHPAVLNTLAIAYAELGDWQAATDIFDQEIGKLGDDPLADEFRLLLE